MQYIKNNISYSIQSKLLVIISNVTVDEIQEGIIYIHINEKMYNVFES